MTQRHYTVDELICACISRQIKDGELVAQGLATPLAMAGILLARVTHAPHLMFASAIGNSLCADWSPLSIAHIEATWVGKALRFLSFTQIVCDILPTFSPKEFFRPAQIDQYGNQNNIAIGHYTRPRLRLPGAGGIPDVTPISREVYLYNPRHSKLAFPVCLDFISGVGVRPQEERQRLGITSPGPRWLVTDLGCFDFANGPMRVISLHPGVTLDMVQRKTSFPLEESPDLITTPPPTAEELDALRDLVDPLGVRKLEVLSGRDRWEHLSRIVAAEHNG